MSESKADGWAAVSCISLLADQFATFDAFIGQCDDLAKDIAEKNPFHADADGNRMKLLVAIAREWDQVIRDRDALRAKLAAVYSILVRREAAYGDEVEGLILTAAHLAATAEAEWAQSKANTSISEIDCTNTKENKQ